MGQEVSLSGFCGKRLKAARRAKQLSRFKLAVALGVTERSVMYWEIGAHAPGGESLAKLARILGVEVDYFFREAK